MMPSTLVHEQERDAEILNRAIDGVNAKVGALDPNLRPEVLQERGAAIRKESVATLENVRAATARRVAMAAEMARHYTPEVERRGSAAGRGNEARLADAAISLSCKLSLQPNVFPRPLVSCFAIDLRKALRSRRRSSTFFEAFNLLHARVNECKPIAGVQ